MIFLFLDWSNTSNILYELLNLISINVLEDFYYLLYAFVYVDNIFIEYAEHEIA